MPELGSCLREYRTEATQQCFPLGPLVSGTNVYEVHQEQLILNILTCPHHTLGQLLGVKPEGPGSPQHL